MSMAQTETARETAQSHDRDCVRQGRLSANGAAKAAQRVSCTSSYVQASGHGQIRYDVKTCWRDYPTPSGLAPAYSGRPIVLRDCD